MQLIKMNVLRTETRRKSNYYSLVDGVLYGNTWPDEHRTHSWEPEQLIIKNSCACHNFTPFKIGKDLYALGGMDAWKFEESWKHVESYEEFKIKFRNRFKTEYTRDAERYEMFKDRIKDKKSLNHSDGLYLFKKTDNGWSQVHKKPTITTHDEGFRSALDYGKSSEFDGQPSIVFINDTYYLYLRYNVKFKTRFIQFSSSKNLIDWEPFEEIKVDGFDYDKDNYYTPNFFRYGEFVLGMIPYFREDQACIRLLKSTDYTNFTVEGEIFNSYVEMLTKNAPKNPVVPVQGVSQDKDIILTFHENYLGIRKKEPVEIVQYRVNKQEFEDAFNL